MIERFRQWLWRWLRGPGRQDLATEIEPVCIRVTAITPEGEPGQSLVRDYGATIRLVPIIEETGRGQSRCLGYRLTLKQASWRIPIIAGGDPDLEKLLATGVVALECWTKHIIGSGLLAEHPWVTRLEASREGLYFFLRTLQTVDAARRRCEATHVPALRSTGEEDSMIVGEGTYDLQGSEAQVAILAPCFDPTSPYFIRFPWFALNQRPPGAIPIGWTNLNATYSGAMHAHGVHKRAGDLGANAIPGHVDMKDKDGREGHGIIRRTHEGRWFIAGVFWTDGRIQIDTRCEAEPELAREVMSAELAHSVDYFLPLSDDQKGALAAMLHPEGGDEHTWWETHDYAAEYYDLVGETFMALFTFAYAPAIEPYQDAFTHKANRGQAEKVRVILGVPEYLPEAPPVEPPTEPPAEEPPAEPEGPPPPSEPGPEEPPTLPPTREPQGIQGWVAAALAAAAGVIGIIVGWFL